MQAVILAGGLGSRLSEETILKPKPMVEIGGKPILWHILKIYSGYGINEFIICCGYKGYVIKEYFSNYFLHNSDVTIDLYKNSLEIHTKKSEPWKITLIDTGEESMTGGRLKRVQQFIKEDIFCFTYGDGLADIDICELIKFHKRNNKLATLTAVRPPARFGKIKLNGKNKVTLFREKSSLDEGWINGGFFIIEPEVLSLIKSDKTFFERQPLEILSQRRQLMAFKHKKNWQCMDTLRDKEILEKLLKKKIIKF